MFKLLLIWRYFIKKRVALIAVAAVTLVVMLVLVVLSIMSGLLDDTRQKNHRWSGDMVISRDSLVGFPYYDDFIAMLRKEELVTAATPVIKTFGLLGDHGSGVQLMGVRLQEFGKVSDFTATLHYLAEVDQPSFRVPNGPDQTEESEKFTDQQKARGCIPGIYLLQNFLGFFGKNDLEMLRGSYLAPPRHLTWPITVFALNSQGALTGSPAGEYQTFYYVDDSDTGLVDVDWSMMYVDFDQLQQLCWMAGQDGSGPRASEIRIRLAANADLEMGRQKVAVLWQQFVEQRRNAGQAKLLEDVNIQTWKEYRRANIAPVENEKSLMILVFGMIGLVAVFIVFAIFYMIVTEKVKDLGIIRSAGGSAWSIRQIFWGYGILIGIVGAVLGTALGGLIVRNSNQIQDWLYAKFGFQLWSPDVYAIDRIPDVVDYREALAIALVAIAASLAGAVLPARRAARLNVVDALRVE